jgi:hypothetical protein
MEEHATKTAPNCSQTDWGQTYDAGLIAALLANDVLALWEFLLRFDSLLTDQITNTFRTRIRTMPSKEFVSDVRKDISDFLWKDNARALRAFDARRGRLGAWLGRLADKRTVRRLLTMIIEDDVVALSNPNRGVS